MDAAVPLLTHTRGCELCSFGVGIVVLLGSGSPSCRLTAMAEVEQHLFPVDLSVSSFLLLHCHITVTLTFLLLNFNKRSQVSVGEESICSSKLCLRKETFYCSFINKSFYFPCLSQEPSTRQITRVRHKFDFYAKVTGLLPECDVISIWPITERYY